MHPVRDLSEGGRVGLGRLVARERIPPDERHGEQEGRPAQARLVEDPGDDEDREADPEAEGRDHERRPEAGRLRERGEVGVEQVDARDLEGVRGADHEPRDPGVQGEKGAERPEQVDATLDARVDDAGEDEEADPDDADHQRERGEQRPAGDVVAPRHPGRADRLRRRRCIHADSEREDAGGHVPVGGDDAPAHGVRLALDEPLDVCVDERVAPRLRDRPGVVLPVRAEDDDRVRGRHDRLVEAERDVVGRRLDAALLRGGRLLHRRVRRRGGRDDQREGDGREEGPSHGLPPASSERCPKMDATSRSANSITARRTHVAANP